MKAQLSVDIFHNVLWAKYKGDIFKKLLEISALNNVHVCIYQIAETELARVSLGSVNREDHQYQYNLLFEGPYESVNSIVLWARLAKILWSSKSQVVVLPGYHRIEHWIMLLIGKIKSKRVLVFCDSTALDNKKRVVKELLKTLFFRSVDGALCYGSASAEYVRGYLPHSHDDKLYCPCSSASIPFETYNFEEIKEQRIFLKSQISKQFLFVGRLSPEKGILDLIQAWAESDILPTNHFLKIAGEGPQRGELEQKIEDLGISSSVQLLGACTKHQLNQLYKESFALVLPSYSEPWGLVVNEAYYFGCPVIMSEHCGCMPDLCIDKYVQVMRTGDTDHLKRLMENLLQQTDYEAIAVKAYFLISGYTPDSAAERIFSSLTAEK